MKHNSKFEIVAVKQAKQITHFDFLIDGEPLSKKLNIDRLDMAYADFDLDIIEQDGKRWSAVKHNVAVYLGFQNPHNQFNTNRVVLYRCHCGSDYCGVISFELKIAKNEIIWNDIRYENEGDQQLESVLNIEELSFDKTEYENEFQIFLKKQNFKTPNIYVDFNELIEKDLVLLSQKETKKDILGNEVLLFEGKQIDIYMDDEDTNGEINNLIASGTVEANNSGHFPHVKWNCRIDKLGIRNER